MASLGRLGTWARSLWLHDRDYPFATNLSLISIPIGLLAVGIGPEISRGFGNVFHHNPIPVYVWGVALLLGGLQVARGIIQHHPSGERAGLYILAGSYAFYAVCVVIGLRLGGLVTGPVFSALALSCVQRAHAILVHAKVLRDLGGHHGGPADCDAGD